MHKHHKAIDKKILDYEKPRRVALVCSRGVKDGKVATGKEHKQREADERIPNAPQRLRNAREQTACSGGAAGLGSPAGFWSPWDANTVSEAGVRTGAGAEGRTGRLRSYAARVARPNASVLAKRLAGSSAIDMQTASASGVEMLRASHCSRMSSPGLGSTPVKQKNNRAPSA